MGNHSTSSICIFYQLLHVAKTLTTTTLTRFFLVAGFSYNFMVGAKILMSGMESIHVPDEDGPFPVELWYSVKHASRFIRRDIGEVGSICKVFWMYNLDLYIFD